MITDSDLLAYLEEALPADQMSLIEASLRDDSALGRRLGELIERREAGVHTLGDIWRRQRLSCPPRERIEAYLEGTLDEDEAEYIQFHLTTLGCSYCQASHDDLKSKQPATEEKTPSRQRYFESSIGLLRSRMEE